jgi:energy-coupling factor transporter ATP-binding protein EcfA2
MKMKIKTIEIHNYKAFYGDKNIINIDGKNLFIYGENGSGKSSLYYALKDFFQSSVETIDLTEVENIFIDPADKGKIAIKLTFNPDTSGTDSDQLMELSVTTAPSGIEIRDAYQLRSFLNYKHLLAIHNIKKNDEINLFDLLIKGVLKHFKIIGMTGPLGDAWQDIENLLTLQTNKRYNIVAKRQELNKRLKIFNDGFGTLFIHPTPTSPNPDYILDSTNKILSDFDKDIKIELSYDDAKLSSDAKAINNGRVKLDIEYGGKSVSKPHLFLNEARLSAIAISIYLGMIKRLPQLNKMKILFLDDLFIGLDLSNRMPLMQILERDFADYQIIISTYDKPWYEIIKFYLQRNPNWKSVEFLSRKNQYGYDQPLIRYADDGQRGNHIEWYLGIAQDYYDAGDNKAAGVYLRGAFEFMLKIYCKKKHIRVKFDIDSLKQTTEDFWLAIKDYKITEDAKVKGTSQQQSKPSKCKLTDVTIKKVEFFRKFVLNPLCHQDQTRHEFSQEIKKTIDVLKKLKQELGI